jgi:hypothetical protein
VSILLILLRPYRLRYLNSPSTKPSMSEMRLSEGYHRKTGASASSRPGLTSIHSHRFTKMLVSDTSLRLYCQLKPIRTMVIPNRPSSRSRSNRHDSLSESTFLPVCLPVVLVEEPASSSASGNLALAD